MTLVVGPEVLLVLLKRFRSGMSGLKLMDLFHGCLGDWGSNTKAHR